MTTNPERNIAKGITIAPPVIGRITMGHTVVKGGKTLPVKDDHFSLTTLRQNASDRTWEPHPLMEALKKDANTKLREIPVRVAYNDLRLNLSHRFSVFTPDKGRLVCSGNGDQAMRMTEEGVRKMDCPGPEQCLFGTENRCTSMTRVYLRIEGQEDPFGVFILRTTGYNSTTTLEGRLAALHGLTKGDMAGIPMTLRMVTKTTAASFRTPIQFADLVARPGMTIFEAVREGKEYRDEFEENGLSLEGMEKALAEGLKNGAFSDQLEDPDEWLSDADLVAAVEKEGLGSGNGSASSGQVGRLNAALEAAVKSAKGDAQNESANGADTTQEAAEPQAKVSPVDSKAQPATSGTKPAQAPAEPASLPGIPLSSVLPFFPDYSVTLPPIQGVSVLPSPPAAVGQAGSDPDPAMSSAESEKSEQADASQSGRKRGGKGKSTAAG